VIHGDLTGSNVLIDSNHTARLTDFGLSAFNEDCNDAATSHSLGMAGGAIRWQATELLDYQDFPNRTSASDIYSFGSLMLQVRTFSLARCRSPYTPLFDIRLFPEKSRIITSRGILTCSSVLLKG
jgi:serine/threonine protein kinase